MIYYIEEGRANMIRMHQTKDTIQIILDMFAENYMIKDLHLSEKIGKQKETTNLLIYLVHILSLKMKQ